MAEQSGDERYWVHLECSGLGDPEALMVLHMTGREEISRPFEFDLSCRPKAEPVLLEDFQAMLDGRATISFGPDREHPIQGVIREIQIDPSRDLEDVTYRIRVVPRLTDTALTRGSWIYQDLLPADIIKKAFTEILPEGARFTDGDDFEMELSGSYQPREYVVQFEETVFDFIHRQAEHWGLFYYFEHAADAERIVFGDANGGFPQLPGFEEIECDDRSGVVDLTERILDITATRRVVPAQVELRDYNYRTPSVDMISGMVPIDEAGIGDVHESNDHFWTPAEGSGLAAIRAQEMFTRKLRMTARSRVRGLRCGHRFTLTGGTPELLGLARDYVVVAVEHHYNDGATPRGDSMPYHNTLTLLPYEVPFRPARTTPVPRIYGITHARIDSEKGDDGVNAPCDDFGRYKVVMPWDVAGETGGKASCWIRVASMSGGAGYGFGQQYHVNDEVALYHLHGDPDRPVIAGAIPNHEQTPVVTSQNANRQVISTRGGASFTFSD